MKLFFRNIFARIYAYYLIKSGCVKNAVEGIKSNKIILSIYFHNPTSKVFNECINWLTSNNFHFLLASDLILISSGKLPFPQNGVIITVDDGWKDNIKNIVPLANLYNIPVTIFVTTDPVASGGGFWWSYIKKALKLKITQFTVADLKMMTNRKRKRILNDIKKVVSVDREAMDKNQLIQIASSNNIHIGSHTNTHPILPNCTDQEAEFEIKYPRTIIESWIHKPVISFAYPNGDFSDRDVELVKKAGYQIAFSTRRSYIIPSLFDDLFVLPRFEILDDSSINENICRMTGIWFAQNRNYFK